MQAKRTKAIERYRRDKQLGEGTFGVVFLALDTANQNRKVAVKQIRKVNLEDGVRVAELIWLQES